MSYPRLFVLFLLLFPLLLFMLLIAAQSYGCRLTAAPPPPPLYSALRAPRDVSSIRTVSCFLWGGESPPDPECALPSARPCQCQGGWLTGWLCLGGACPSKWDKDKGSKCWHHNCTGHFFLERAIRKIYYQWSIIIFLQPVTSDIWIQE